MGTQRLFISAVSSCLTSEIVEQINDRHQTLVNTISIDFADTKFFLKTGFARVEIVQDFCEVNEHRLSFVEDSAAQEFKAILEIPVASFDTTALSCAFELAKLEAIKAICSIVDRFDLDSRSFKIRAFHIQGEIARTKIYRELPDQEFDYARDLQIRMKLPEDIPAYHFLCDFLLFVFLERIETMLVESALGEVEGNDFGEGWFTLYLVGDNPRRMLECISPYLLESTNSKEDYVLLVDEQGKEEIPICMLGTK